MYRLFFVGVLLFLAFPELTCKSKWPSVSLKPKKKPPCSTQIETVCPDPDLSCMMRTCINFYVKNMTLNKKCKFTNNCVLKQKTCKCDGYAYDTRRSKCVLPSSCMPYWWSPATKQAQTENADLILKTGGFGIVRYNDNKNYMVGRLDTADGTAYPLWHNTNVEFEIKVTDPNNAKIEMLLALPGKDKWKVHNKKDRANVPKDAVLAGMIFPGKRQYIGRSATTRLKPGKVEKGLLYVYDTVTKTVQNATQYSVLCIYVPKSSPNRKAEFITYIVSITTLFCLH